MKVAISGKGGVGKTTLSAMLAAALSARGRRVIAVDADPDANLAAALGVPPERQPAPLAEMRDLIAERTGSKDAYGGYFKLNPKVDDIPEKYAAKIGEIRLLVLGGVSRGGGGCICPASALIKALLTHLVLGRDDALIMDMEAGIEHLGRATAQSMDALVVVVDASPWSVETALRIRGLAGDLGMTRLGAIVNRVGGTGARATMEKLARRLDGIPVIGRIPYDVNLEAGVVRTSGDGRLEAAGALDAHRGAIEEILSALEG